MALLGTVLSILCVLCILVSPGEGVGQGAEQEIKVLGYLRATLSRQVDSSRYISGLLAKRRCSSEEANTHIETHGELRKGSRAGISGKGF